MTTVVKSLILVSDREPLDITDQVGSDISTYLGQKLYAVIIRNGLVPEAIDLNKLISKTPNIASPMSYETFLTMNTLSDLAVAGVSAAYLPQINTSTGKYDYRVDVFDPIRKDGISVGYGSIDEANIANDIYRMDTATDLLIQPSDTTVDMSNWLCAVNGVFHTTVLAGGTLYVQDGYLNMRQCRKQSTVVLDTSAVGGHTTYRITKEMITSDLSDLNNRIVISTKGVVPTLTGKTVFLVLDGILYPLKSDVYGISGLDSIVVESVKIDWVGNFINSPNMRMRTDVFGVKNHANPFNPDEIITSADWGNDSDADDSYLNLFVGNKTVSSSFLNSEYYLSRIVSPHSFLVVLNNSDIYLKRYRFVTYGDAYRYECFNTDDMPRGFFRYNHGKVLPYNVVSSTDGQHRFIIDVIDKTADVYRTIPSPAVLASPAVQDIEPNSTKYAELYEIYSGNSGGN